MELRKFLIILGLITSLTVGLFKLAFAAFNEKINYQGKLTDTSSQAVSDGAYDFVFNLYTVGGGGSATWTESWTNAALWTETSITYTNDGCATGVDKVAYTTGTNESTLAAGQYLWNITKGESAIVQSVDTVNNWVCVYDTPSAWSNGDDATNRIYVKSGLFSVMLGTVSSLSSVNFNQTLYLGVTVGADSEMKPRKILGATPAAFEAKQLGGYTWAIPGTIGSGTPNTGAFTTLTASTSVTTPLLQTSSGVLTIQPGASGGADDIIFKPAGSEKMRILETGGDLFFEKGTYDLTVSVTAPTGASRTLTIPALGADGNLAAYGGGLAGGDLLYGATTNVMGRLTIGSANQVLGVVGAGGSLEYKTISGASSEIDITHGANSITIGIVDPLIVGKGGTGAGTFTQYGVLYGNATSAFGVTGAGSTGQLLIATTSAAPSWGTAGSSHITDNSLDFVDFENTLDLDANLILNQSTYTWTQNFTGTTTTGLTYNANSLSSGTAASIASTSTAGTASGSSYLLNLSRSGANTNTAHTAYGLYATVINTNATSGTNIAAYLSASGATTANYGLIVENGYVGIGTATPNVSLHVDGDARLEAAHNLYFSNWSGAGYLTTYNSSPHYGIKYDAPGAGSGWYGVHDFYTGYNGAASTLAMRIKNGMVGIGTDSPDRALDVLSTSEQLRLTYTDSTAYTEFKTTSSGYLNISPSGERVGIGTENPSQRLEINYGNLRMNVVSAPGACTAALAGLGAGNVDNGNHYYKIAFVTAYGETNLGTASNVVTVTDKATDGQVSLTSIPTGAAGTGVTSRKIYRTKAIDSNYYYLATISNNTATTYTDNIADSSLTVDWGNKQNTTGGLIYGGASRMIKVGTGGMGDVAIGYDALPDTTYPGGYNVAIGYSALGDNTTGTANVAIGTWAMDQNETGDNNVAIGFNALAANISGGSNVAIGRNTLITNISGASNTAIGGYVLFYNTGGGNFGLGTYAGFHNTSGAYNVALGVLSLYGNTTGGYNIGIGTNALYYLSSGNSYNTAIGYFSGIGYQPATAQTGAIAAGTELNVGTYYYRVSFVLDNVETALSAPTAAITTTTNNQRINLSAIPTYTGPKNCSARKLYRTKTADSGIDYTKPYYLVATINDNSTPTYADSTTDAGLGAQYDGVDKSIALGSYAKFIGSNELVVGDIDYKITDTYWGSGIYGASPSDITFNASGGSGTNNAGASLIFASGKATGNASGGSIIFKTSDVGASGASAQSLTEKMRINAAGNVGINDTTPDAKFDIDYTSTSATGSSEYASRLTLSDTGVVTIGTDTTYGHYVDVTRTGATGGTIDTYGVYSNVTADNAGAGTSKAVGGYFSAAGADSNYGLIVASGNVGIGTSGPDRKLDVLDTTAAQLRLTYTDSTAYTDFQTDSAGDLNIDPSGDDINLDTANLLLYRNSGDQSIEIADANVSHGLTDIATAYDHIQIKGNSSTAGGARIAGITDEDSVTALHLYGILGVTDPTDTIPAITLNAAKKLTTNVQSLASAETVLQVQNNTSALLTVLGDGKVGIGTTAPERNLDILNSVSTNPSMIRAGVFGSFGGVQQSGDSFFGSNFYLDSSNFKYLNTHANLGYSGMINDYTGSANNIHFIADNVATTKDATFTPSYRMTILGSGNVGIGTTAPSGAKLDVDTGSNTEGLRLRGTAETAEIGDIYIDSAGQLILSTVAGTDTGGFIDLRSEDDQYGIIIRESDGTGTSPYANLYVTDATDDYLTIGVNSVTDGDALVVTAANKVGIGTITPTNLAGGTGRALLLQDSSNYPTIGVKTTGTEDGAFFVQQNDNASTRALYLGTYSSANASAALFGVARANNSFIFPASGGALVIGTQGTQDLTLGTNNAANVTIQSGGNVGIGDASPAALLTVGSGDLFQVNSSGVIAAAAGITSSGTITFSGLTADRPVITTTGGQLTTEAQLALSRGGTAANLTASNGGIVYSTASAFAILSGTATAQKILMSQSSTAPVWSTPTYPNTATLNKVLVGDGTNVVLSTPTLPVTSSPTAGKVMIGDGTNWVASTPTYPNASATAGKILRSDGTNFIASTSTFADTYAVSTLLYASPANTVAGLATANSGVLVTSSTGVPSILGSMTNGQLVVGSTGATPVLATLTGTASEIDVTNAAGSITIGIVDPLVVGKGGTGAGTFTANGVLYGNTTSAIQVTAAGTTGQVLLGNTSAAPSWGTAGSSAITNDSLDFVDFDNTLDLDVALTLNQTTNTWTQSFTGTTTTGLTYNANSLSSGTAASIASTSTAGTASGSSFLLNLSRSGANTNTAHTAYGLYATVINTNATSGTNIAAYLSASGATTANYGLIVENGNVGIGLNVPNTKVHISQTAAEDAFRVDDEAGDSSPFIIKYTGDVGIGITGPTHKLHISDDSTTAARAGLYVNQAGATASGTGYGIYVTKAGASAGDNMAGYFAASGSSETNTAGYFAASGAANTNRGGYFAASGATTNYGLIVSQGLVGIGTSGPQSQVQISGGGLCVGSDTDCNTDNNDAGTVYSSSQHMTVYDVAENYPTKDNTLEAGDIVVTDQDNEVFVKRASATYAPNILGVISTEPGVLLGGFAAKDYLDEIKVPVALSGRVPVKIASSSTEIKVGDFLTSSSEPGKAMKAEEAGYVIGKALENWTPDSGEEKIQVFVNLSWYGGSLNEDGTIVSQESGIENQQAGIIDELVQKVKKALASLGLLIENGVAQIKEVVTEKLTAKIARIERMEMIDQRTGDIYCTWVENGEFKKVRGECSTIEFINLGDSALGAEPLPESELSEIQGCTDPDASNYNPQATVTDDTCEYQIKGCTDSEAINYNPGAKVDDGLCVYENQSRLEPEPAPEPEPLPSVAPAEEGEPESGEEKKEDLDSPFDLSEPNSTVELPSIPENTSPVADLIE